MRKIFFVSFATTDIKPALNRIGRQAKKCKLFDEILLHTEKTIPKYAQERCSAIMERTGRRRGYAYWSWKPVVIRETLQKMQNGDILVYSDAGTHVNPRGRQKLLDYIEMAAQNDIWVTRLSDGSSDTKWTKHDTIDFFRQKITDSAKRLEFDQKITSGMLQSGTIILAKNDYTERLIAEWEKHMSVEHLHLFDDSPSFEPESAQFKENRHDQSILSLLLKNGHYASTSVSHFWSKDKWKGGGSSLPNRNRSCALETRDRLSQHGCAERFSHC